MKIRTGANTLGETCGTRLPFSLVVKDRHSFHCPVRRNEVLISVEIEIGCMDSPHSIARLEHSGIANGPVAPANEHGNRTGALACRHDIDMTIAVEVGRADGAAVVPGRVTHRATKCPIASMDQDRDHGLRCHLHNVKAVNTIHVSCHDPTGRFWQRIGNGRRESAIARVRENQDLGSPRVGHGNVGPTIAVKIGHVNSHGVGDLTGRLISQLEPGIAIVEEKGDAAAAVVRNNRIEILIAVQVGKLDTQGKFAAHGAFISLEGPIPIADMSTELRIGGVDSRQVDNAIPIQVPRVNGKRLVGSIHLSGEWDQSSIVIHERSQRSRPGNPDDIVGVTIIVKVGHCGRMRPTSHVVVALVVDK